MVEEKYDGTVNDYNTFINYLDTLALIISKMFGENCEVVVSDLDKCDESVIAIYNGHVTGRKVGDPLNTMSEELIERSIDGFNINYKKANKKNKKEIKSSTLVTKAFGRNISFCINYDCDDLNALQYSLKSFLSMSDQVYDEFDVEDSQGLLEKKIDLEIQKIGKPLVSMSKDDRLKFMKNLKKSGVFNIQKSVPYVAEILGVTRYTIYNYLNEIQKTSED